MGDRQTFYRDTWVEVNLEAIEENIRSIQSIYQGREMNIMAVVKANGYGHGAIEVARIAIQAGASHLAVALLDEAIELRQAGVEAPILVLGRTRPEDAATAIHYKIILTVSQLDWLRKAETVIKGSETLYLHVKVDTGMGRIGIREKDEAKQLFRYIDQSPLFQLNGVYTHFATADELELTYFDKQYERYLGVLKWLDEWGIRARYIHCGNSATGMRFPKLTFNMFRLGISMYGLSPSPEIKDSLPVQLNPAFSLKSRLVQVKQLPKGEAISYGATYRTNQPEWIGTIPIGYADGWLRANSSEGGHVLVDGEKAPFVGRICMDQCMIRLPKRVEVGTLVTLIGSNRGSVITVDEVALRLKTINYEIPCMVNTRVPRVFTGNE